MTRKCGMWINSQWKTSHFPLFLKRIRWLWHHTQAISKQPLCKRYPITLSSNQSFWGSSFILLKYIKDVLSWNYKIKTHQNKILLSNILITDEAVNTYSNPHQTHTLKTSNSNKGFKHTLKTTHAEICTLNTIHTTRDFSCTHYSTQRKHMMIVRESIPTFLM